MQSSPDMAAGVEFSPKKQEFGLHVEKLPQNQNTKHPGKESPHINNFLEMTERSDEVGTNLQKRNAGAGSGKNAPRSGQVMLLKVPEGQDLNKNETEAEVKLK